MLYAQAPQAILEFVENESEILIIDVSGAQKEGYAGLDLAMGDTVRTKKTTAELRLTPNGTIIKLAANTSFTVEALQGRDNEQANSFSLVAGKVRTIAAKGKQNNYSLKTPTAVCGVRGTDFAAEFVENFRDAVAVQDGEIEFINLKTGQSLKLLAGQFADTFADIFRAVDMGPDQMKEFFSDMDFKGLNPSSVPGYEGTAAQVEPEKPAKSAPAEAPQPALVQPAVQPAAAEAPKPIEEKVPGPLDGFFAALGDMLSMEIGAATIGSTTYSKAVLSPTFKADKFKLGLYLPVVYSSNLFDPSTWYRPNGNNEWSFGTDQTGVANILMDIARDAALKIKMLEIGEQRDIFYLKLGNLNSMTVGHGLIMNDYANDLEFPAVRRIGFNMGLDVTGFGFEVVANDLAEPEIFGLRLFFRPIKDNRFALGFTGIADINPGGDMEKAVAESLGDPVFINAGIDLDIPIVETDAVLLVLFTDIAAMLPYFRTKVAGTNYVGFTTDTLFVTSPSFSLRNYGAAAGLLGRIAIVDWRLEYRNFNGTFRPAFYNNLYDRKRGEYVSELALYLQNPSHPSYVKQVMGVYGEAGVHILERLHLKAGYFWPWEIGQNGLGPSDDDYFMVKLALEKGLIPFVNLSASVAYERTKFMPTIISGQAKNLSLFDAYTAVKAEFVYPVTEVLDIAFLVTTNVLRNSQGQVLADPLYDANGNGLYDAADGDRHRLYPSFGIETRIHF